MGYSARRAPDEIRYRDRASPRPAAASYVGLVRAGRTKAKDTAFNLIGKNSDPAKPGECSIGGGVRLESGTDAPMIADRVPMTVRQPNA